MKNLDIYNAKELGNKKRKYCITINMEDLCNRSLIIPKSMDDVFDCWQLFDHDCHLSEDDTNAALEWVMPLISEILDKEDLKDYINHCIREVLRQKIEHAIFDVWMNSLNNIYLEFSDQDVGNPLISSLESWYSSGSIDFYLSQKQVNKYLKSKHLTKSDFDNDPDEVQNYLQEQAKEKENLSPYNFDRCYYEFLENSDKDCFIGTFKELLDGSFVILKGDKFEQFKMAV